MVKPSNTVMMSPATVSLGKHFKHQQEEEKEAAEGPDFVLTASEGP